VLNPVEILASKLTYSRNNAIIQPSLLNPPSIQTSRVSASRSARTR